MNTVYQEALAQYEAGAYDKATDLFCHLSEELPLSVDVWKGLAACYQMRTYYHEALLAWGMAALLDRNDPVAHFHAAECLLAKGEAVEARKAIRIGLGLPCTEELLNKMVSLKEVIDRAS